MTFEEALKAIRDNKKVIRPGWLKGFYWSKNVLSGQSTHSEIDDYNLDWDDFLAEDWEIIE